MILRATDRGEVAVNRAVQIGCVGPGSRTRRTVSSFYNVQCIYSLMSSANAVVVVVLFA